MHILLSRLRDLRDNTSGVALLEFAFVTPVFLLMSLTGAELTNYITTRMRISQVALHLADNAARMGSGSQLAAKTVSETMVNDLFTGANLQSGELALTTHGRMILSDLEVDPSNTGKYKIIRQRCSGSQTSSVSAYGVQGTGNLTGMGTTGRQATAPSGGATMYAEVFYTYVPLIKAPYGNDTSLTAMYEQASMMVRDTRDLTQFYNTENATVSTC